MGTYFTGLWNHVCNWFLGIGDSFHGAFNHFGLGDILDILLVTLVFYFLIRLVRNSRAEQVFKGIITLLAIYVFARIVNMTAVLFFFKILFDNALVILIVVFQPEIRRALEQVGHSRDGIFRGAFSGLRMVDNAEFIEQNNKAFRATAQAMKNLQEQKMGALVVFERATRLGDIVRSGTLIESEPSAALISTVFFDKSPLHDGAMIIRDGKVYAAACILPLSDNPLISRELGTRHRAGVGMSETSDAVVVILSEETGNISIAEGGVLTRNFAPENLEKELADRLLWKQDEAPIVKKIRGRKSGKKEGTK